MGEKLVIGPINRGLRKDVTAFVIDNDSFPTLINAYQWRSRIKRKRGTQFLTRLQRFFNSLSTAYTQTSTILLDGSGNGNLITGFGLETNASIVPGTVVITAPGPTIFTDNGDGTFTPSGTINYATGAITIAAAAGLAVSAVFNYYPDLPVMGLRDFTAQNTTNVTTQFPGTLAFDTKYAYNIITSFPYNTYDVTFYKNPPASASLPGYVPKATVTPFTWHGQDYQQFWSINYQNAFWVTNGMTQPFDPTKIGMQFNTITNITVGAAGPPAIITITTGTNHGLVVGDWVFLNEIVGMTGINYQTGYVIATPAANQITVELPNATVGGAYVSGGIVQYLTNNSNALDCLKWYDGDPTNGSATAPVLNGQLGWVNFCPPLSNNAFSIADTPPAVYYLVGAKLLFNFKDRLIAFGPVIQTSSANSQIYLQDTIIYSQNGTPFYTMSFTAPAANYPLFPTNFQSVLVPINQTAQPQAWFEDISGFGGFLSAGIQQQILTVGPHQDVLIVGFTRLETQLVYTGNDDLPFNFYKINSELGVESTFSAVVMDKGVLTQGSRGFLITNQVESRRIDLEIPDEIFEMNRSGNGPERATAHRDFINEWVYFTYKGNEFAWKFPTQTLQFNYRDNSWAIFYETYTTYGLFRKKTGFTWATVGSIYPTWNVWTDSWAAGESNLLQPDVIGGDQQGFVLIRGIGTDEGPSLFIQGFSNSVITSPDHCLNVNDFIIISGAMGTVSTAVNGKTFQIIAATQNTITIAPALPTGLTYIGGGVITRLYIPFIQSRQFPFSWSMARKTRIGAQQYLLTTTDNAQITLLMFLSQNSDFGYNYLNFPFNNDIVPDPNSQNNSLVYSAILYTCPESTNLGLTPANINLQMVTGIDQEQIWHRINTSLLGDTVQIGFTMSNSQMTTYTNVDSPLTITGITNANPCVITVDNTLSIGNLVRIDGVVGTTQLNFQPLQYNYYLVTAVSPTTITLDVDSSAFGVYTGGGTVQEVFNYNQTAEIELHGFIVDLAPSQLLA